MSDYAYIVGRVRRAQSAVSSLEYAVRENPSDQSLQLNLHSARRLYERSLIEMEALTESNGIAVCDYRIRHVRSEEYGVRAVTLSVLRYQEMFSQIYAAVKDGPKNNVGVREAMERESDFSFGYTYAGSLGFVFLAQDQRNLFNEGEFDEPVRRILSVMFAEGVTSIRSIGRELGRAVVKRAYDWFDTNAKAGYSADVKWKRSDGIMLGGMVENDRMRNVVWDIQNTFEEDIDEVSIVARLVGGDTSTNSFHLAVPNGDSYQGRVSSEAIIDRRRLGDLYRARIRVTRRYNYATDLTSQSNLLLDLTSAGDDNLNVGS